MSEKILPVRSVERAFNVEDMTIRSDGSGRVVEAYAAVFGQRAEIMDQDGHYEEELDKGSFTRTLQHRGINFGVLFNHGRTVDGAPNPAATMPIGVPLEVAADERGVFTATRYLDNPLADWTLDAIRNRALRAQSFSGRYMRSQRSWPNGRAKGMLPVITRMEVAMREYGPAVFAAYDGAEILGTRMADVFVRSLLAVPPAERVQWLQKFEGGATLLDPAPSDLSTPTGTAETAEPRAQHSAQQLRERISRYRDAQSKNRS